MDSACLRDARRVMVAQLALVAGPDALRERIGLLLEGRLGEEEARVLRADLDRMAGLLLS